MGRLIDADALLESFRKCYSGHLGMENSDAMMMFRSICKIINNEPTAYDVEKVVKELDNESFYTCDYGFVNDNYKALDIVRNGGKE